MFRTLIRPFRGILSTNSVAVFISSVIIGLMVYKVERDAEMGIAVICSLIILLNVIDWVLH